MHFISSYQSPALDWNKLKALVHYICDRAPNPKLLGATKLNKILFYSDMEAYLTLGSPITGETYVKQQFGPVPKDILTVLDDLQKEKRIAISEASGFHIYSGEARPPRQFYPLVQPTLDLFKSDEISLVDSFVDYICRRHTARSISKISHDVIWASAEIGEEIPYFTAYANSLGGITPEDVTWARATIGSRTGSA